MAPIENFRFLVNSVKSLTETEKPKLFQPSDFSEISHDVL
jgi:hypothetical protein